VKSPLGLGKLLTFFYSVQKKFKTENIIIIVFCKYLVDFKSEAWVNLFWEYINGKLFAVQAEPQGADPHPPSSTCSEDR
jgi:hypothetical protein